MSVFDLAHGDAPLPPITGGGLSYPIGMVVDRSGKLYVADSAGSAIRNFDLSHGNAAL